MAEEKSIFPLISARAWWTLRKRFKRTMPSVVTKNYLSTVLGTSEKTATNILPILRRIGLINEEGAPTERANHWRADEDYAKVCADIMKDIYPKELLEAVPDPVSDLQPAVRWIMRHTGMGEGAANNVAKFYRLLSEADVSKEQEATEPTNAKRESKPTAQKVEKASPPKADKPIAPQVKPEQPATEKHKVVLPGSSPSIHIDIQIHISPEASTNQIDQIFASMAKHLYTGSGTKNE